MGTFLLWFIALAITFLIGHMKGFSDGIEAAFKRLQIDEYREEIVEMVLDSLKAAMDNKNED